MHFVELAHVGVVGLLLEFAHPAVGVLDGSRCLLLFALLFVYGLRIQGCHVIYASFDDVFLVDAEVCDPGAILAIASPLQDAITSNKRALLPDTCRPSLAGGVWHRVTPRINIRRPARKLLPLAVRYRRIAHELILAQQLVFGFYLLVGGEWNGLPWSFTTRW